MTSITTDAEKESERLRYIKSWEDFFSSPLRLSEDFSTERDQKLPQNRDELFSSNV